MHDRADMEACHERLHRAGWSIGVVETTIAWLGVQNTFLAENPRGPDLGGVSGTS